jgi:hypothetical protein
MITSNLPNSCTALSTNACTSSFFGHVSFQVNGFSFPVELISVAICFSLSSRLAPKTTFAPLDAK